MAKHAGFQGRLILLCIGFTFLLKIATLTLNGQTTFGTLVGTVVDSSGAEIYGATVTLKSDDTDSLKFTTSGEGGTYSFIDLNPGLYTVTVSQPGFKSFKRRKVDVQIGGFTRADVSLEVGSVTQTINVSSTPINLQTDNTGLGGVVEGSRVVEAPLNGRNVNNLLDFVPGVTPGGGTQGSTIANGGSGNFQAGGQTQPIAYGNYRIGGSFGGQSVFFIDGVESNIAENNVNALVLTQDAVQEFRVSTNNVTAEFGGYGGGVVQVSSKSGTNDVHWNTYEYIRNTAFDANDWFSNHYHLGKSPLHQNQYGGNLGGPLLKNRTFLFSSWEHERLISSSPTSATVPTSTELAGDFSSDPQVIYDPTTGQPFPNNKIPTTRIDPAAQRILQLETPDESRVLQTPFSTNFFASAPIRGHQDQYNVRADSNFGADTVFTRYTFWNPHNEPSDPMGNHTGSGPTGNTTQEGVLGDTHVLNSSLVADLLISYIENYNFQSPLSNGFDMSKIGPAYSAIENESYNKQGQLPGLGIQGYGIGAELSQLYWNNNVWAANGSVSWIHGKHMIKAGGNWRQLLWEGYGNTQGIGINATPFFSAATATDTEHGNALASFLLGIPSSTGISSVGTWRTFLHAYGFYVSDTFQVASKITLTAGLRWEQPGTYSEENNLDSVLQPNAPVNIGSLISIHNPVNGNQLPLTGKLVFVASRDYSSRREEQLHWMLLSPRIGLAYRGDARTVVRTGYGISFLPAEITADSPNLSPVNTANTDITNTVGLPLLATVANPFPNGLNLPTGRTQAGLDATLGYSIVGRVPAQPYAYSQQWNLALERQLGGNATTTLAYAGSKGTHLVLTGTGTGTGLNLNQLPDAYQSLGPELLKQLPNPFYGVLPAGTVLGAPSIAEGYLLLPHPQYPGGMLQAVPRLGDSTYHAFQASFIDHIGNSSTIQAAYTWSKLLSNTDNTSAFEDGQGGLAVVQDSYNLRAEKSLSEQNLANNLVIDYGFDLPLGGERRDKFGMGTLMDSVIAGWRINGIVILRSGIPIALVAAGNVLSQFGGGTDGAIRPNYMAGCDRRLRGPAHSSERATEWFNTACFTQPGSFSYGNEPRVDPQLKSEGEANLDLAMSKSFQLGKRIKLKLTTEIFDIFNHAQFAEPNSSLSSPGFGQVGHQTNLPRTVQFAIRFTQ